MPASRRGVLGGRQAAGWEPPLDRSGHISQAPAHNCVPKESVSGPDRQPRCNKTLFFPRTKMGTAPGSFSSHDTALPTTGKRHTVPLPPHQAWETAGCARTKRQVANLRNEAAVRRGRLKPVCDPQSETSRTHGGLRLMSTPCRCAEED